MPLAPCEIEPSDIRLAITRAGQHINNPTCLPGWKLTLDDRTYLLRYGWVHIRGLYWHPRIKTSEIWDRIQHPERYYDTSYSTKT